LLNARTAMRLDDGHAEFTESLLQVNAPHCLQPFPSSAIVRFETAGGKQRGGAAHVGRGAWPAWHLRTAWQNWRNRRGYGKRRRCGCISTAIRRCARHCATPCSCAPRMLTCKLQVICVGARWKASRCGKLDQKAR
jgi:type VI protein secretion system component VasA